MTARDGWAALGELLGSALVQADQQLAQRFATTIKTRLAYFAVDKALKKAIDRALQGSCDTEGIIRSFGYWNETRDLMVLRSVTSTWEQLTEASDFEPDAAWGALAAELRAATAHVHAEGAQHLEQSRAFESEFRGAEPLSMWPLQEAGDLRDRVRTWVESASARMGVAKRDLIAPDSLPAQMTYAWQGAAVGVSTLAAWLDDRAAWSRALALMLPLLERFAPSPGE
jgi:hypothetical protein